MRERLRKLKRYVKGFEPVRVANAVRALLTVATVLGILTIGQADTDLVVRGVEVSAGALQVAAGAVLAVIELFLTRATRKRVTPVAAKSISWKPPPSRL